MWMFTAMLIGVIGTILIERLYRKPDNEAEWVPVRIENSKSNRSIKNYRS
jgi:hypothetical protein